MVIIIGAGAAGIAALETFRQSDTTTPAVIISGERMPNYSPCALPYLVAADLPRKHLPRLTEDFYKRMRAKTIFGSKVCCIHPDRRSITLDNGKSLFYSKLLIASGSVPIIPPIPGIDAKGVFAVDTLSSSRRIINYLSKNNVKKAAVIGAGFTGIETAIALAKQGIKVVIIELLDRILARILDADFAQIAQQHLEALGIEVRLNTKLTGITASTKGKNKGMVTGIITIPANKPEQKAVIASGAEFIPPLAGAPRGNLSAESVAELVIIAIGVRPNIGFLQNSGITVNKGIVVDDRMLTNITDIYAAGDAVETTDYLTGGRTISAIWPNAIDQGRVAGLNIAGGDTAYTGANAINVINIPISGIGCGLINNQPIVSMGIIRNSTLPIPLPQWERKGEGEVITCQTAQAMRRMYLDDSRIIGFEAIGPTRNLGFIWSCIAKRTDISAIRDKILKDNFIPYRQL